MVCNSLGSLNREWREIHSYVDPDKAEEMARKYAENHPGVYCYVMKQVYRSIANQLRSERFE